MDSAFRQGKQLAELFGAEIDHPTSQTYTNPTYVGDPRFNEFRNELQKIIPTTPFARGGYNPQQFGETQNPPQYRGIRLLLPQSGGSYGPAFRQGRVPQYDAIQQALLGWMITMGYPVLGGIGQMSGFEHGFNPVGFGQR